MSDPFPMHPLESPLFPNRFFKLGIPAMSLSALLFAACTATPPPASLQSLDRELIQRTVQNMTDDMLVPGVVAIIRTPQGEIRVRHGVTSWKGSEPVSELQRIRVGSNTKTWVATVILQMVDEGKLRLQDPVSRYRPDVPNGDRITLEQMLTMRSGLFNYTETTELNVALDREPGKVWRTEELVTMGLARPPYFAPGQGFHYSNTNTVLLGLIAEQIDRKPLAAILNDRLFVPLGMKSTLFPPIESSELPAPRARGYMFGDNASTIESTVLSAEIQAQARAGSLQPADKTENNPSWAWAAGSGISSADELVTWVEALTTGKLLSPALQQQRLASVRPVDPTQSDGAQYGWGIARFGPVYGHSGELPGYNSFMGHDPVAGVTVVVWANLAPGIDGRDPATTIARALIGLIYAAPR